MIKFLLKYDGLDSITHEDILEACKFWAYFSGKSKKKATNSFIKIFYLFKMILRAVLILLKYKKFNKRDASFQEKREILAVSLTYNQEKALNFLKTRKEVHFLSQNYYIGSQSVWEILARSTLKNSFLMFHFLNQQENASELFPWIEEFSRYIGGIKIGEQIFQKINPKILIVSNDNSGIMQAFIKIAKKMNIFTIYTQHAQVGRHTPALNCDLSLLDGIQSYLNYKKNTPKDSLVFITGRLKKPNEKKSKNNNTYLGLALNSDEYFIYWRKLFKKLRVLYPQEKILLRLHPAEKRYFLFYLIGKFYNIQLDTGSLEDFLGKVSLLVSGVSGIILDGALSGKPCFLFSNKGNFNLVKEDYYCYLENKICTIISLDNLEILRNKKTFPNNNVEKYEAGIFSNSALLKNKCIDYVMCSIRENKSVQQYFSENFEHLQKNNMIFCSKEYFDFLSRNKLLGLD